MPDFHPQLSMRLPFLTRVPVHFWMIIWDGNELTQQTTSDEIYAQFKMGKFSLAS